MLAVAEYCDSFVSCYLFIFLICLLNGIVIFVPWWLWNNVCIFVWCVIIVNSGIWCIKVDVLTVVSRASVRVSVTKTAWTCSAVVSLLLALTRLKFSRAWFLVVFVSVFVYVFRVAFLDFGVILNREGGVSEGKFDEFFFSAFRFIILFLVSFLIIDTFVLGYRCWLVFW